MTSIVSIAAALSALAYAPSLAQALALNMGSLSDSRPPPFQYKH